ncbi:MAG: hypothetical protein ABFS05_04570 [Bacteroidota bacterium]
MNKLLVIAFLILLNTLQCTAQVIDGYVTTLTAAPIPEVNVILSTSLGSQGPEIIAETNDEGYFNIQIPQAVIDEANQAGATWKLIADKYGYKKAKRNIFITRDLIEPDNISFMLESDPYSPNYAMVDNCINTDDEVVTIYLFDLQSENREFDISTLLNTLIFKVKREVVNHIEAYNLSGDLKLEITRCSGFEVHDERYAVHYGERLQAEGIIWGFSQILDSINTVISLTYIDTTTLTGLTSISYSNNIQEVVEVSQPISNEYLAFSSYILGKVHLQKGNDAYAKRCFQDAKAMNALPEEYSRSLADLLDEMNAGNIASGLGPIND